MAASRESIVPDNVVTAIGDQLRRRAFDVPTTSDQAGETEAEAAPALGKAAGPPPPDEADHLKRKLLSDWRLVKRARFNASKRLRNRYEAGQFAFAVSGVYGFLVPLFLLQFDGYLTNFAAMVISFVAAVAGALSFTIAMQYQQKDFKLRAGQLHECARRINNLSRHLAATPVNRTEDLRPFIHHYDEVLSTCENHDDVDFALARLTDNPRKLDAEQLVEWKQERWRQKWRLYRQTYTVCGIVWFLPLLTGLLVWLALAPKG